MEYGSYDKSSDKDADMKRRKAFEANNSDEEAEEKPKKLSALESFFENREKDAEKKKDRQEKDAKPPIDKLSESEAEEAIQKIGAETKPEVYQELSQAEANSAEELEAAAVAEFYNQLEEVSIEEGEQAEEVIDKAQKTALDKLELSEQAEESRDKPEEDEDDPAAPVTRSTTTQSTTTPPPPPPVKTGAGGNNLPPTWPRVVAGNNLPPSPPSPPAYRALPGMPPPFGGPNPNVINTPVAQPTIEKEPDYYRRHRGRDLLVGGLVGYFIGRRSGRIKTEERLLPIQHKLEKEVRELHETITRKEAEVRLVAAKKFETATAVELLSRREKIERLKSQPPPTARFENPELLIPNKQKAPERIGSFIIEKSSRLEAAMRKSVELMSVPELLEIAEQVTVENVSLKTMYERGILDQNSLRRAIKEHLQGNRVERLMPELLVGNERRQEMQVEGQLQGQSSSVASQSQVGTTQAHSGYTPPVASSPFTSTQPPFSPLYDQSKPPRGQQAKTAWITLAVVASAAILILLLLV